MNKRGVVLIICYIVIMVLSILGAAFFMRSVSERVVVGKYFDSTQAFWLAETGVNKKIIELRADYTNLNSIGPTTLGAGQYSVDRPVDLGGGILRITAHGFVPSAASAAKVERVVEVEVIKYIPPGFYDNAIYAAGNVNLKGSSIVNGPVFSGGTVTGTANGVITQNDPDLHKYSLALLCFTKLQQMSEAQGWYNSSTGKTTFPNSFWNVAPTSPTDPGIPNVVFVRGDYTITGKKAVNYGFIVVGGNAVYDATIGGNASVVGCIYTRGNIEFKGGGGPSIINLDGGVWAGKTVTTTGNEQINFVNPGNGQIYMKAIEALGIDADVQVISWRETQNPF